MPKLKTIPPVRPNEGLALAYQRKLEALVDEMAKSFAFWIKAAYRAHPPEMALDASPAVALREVMRKLSVRWQTRFDAAAPALAEYFALAAHRRSDRALAAILKKAGFTVDFKMTREVNDVLQASMGEQVSLIKSIAQQHLTQVEGLVMRAVQQGGNLHELTNELEKRYALTRRRAAFIARDQSRKATAVVTRARQQEMGITQAMWVHSGGGNVPRPSHVKAGRDRVLYDVAKGWYDPQAEKVKGGGFRGKYIWPGTLISCRCVGRSVISGLALT